MQLPPSALRTTTILQPGKCKVTCTETAQDACRGPTPAIFPREISVLYAAQCLVGLKQEEHLQEF